MSRPERSATADATDATSASDASRAAFPSPGLVLLAWGAILVVAIVMRFRNLGWGAQPVFDETMYWRVQLYSFIPFVPEKMLDWSLNYPTFFGYLAGAAVGAAHQLGVLPRPYRSYFEAVVIARGVSAAAGVVSVLLIGGLGRRMESRVAGLVAAALLAVVPIEVTQTHYISVDVLQNVFVILAMLAGCILLRRQAHPWALLGGVAAGFAFGTKYNGIAALAAPGWAALEVGFARRSPLRAVTLGLTILAGFALAVLVACPPCVLNYPALLEALRFHSSNSFSSAASSYGANLTPQIGWYARPYLYQLVALLPFVLGWPLYLLSLAGVVAAAIRNRASDRVVLVTVLAFFVLIAGSPIVYPRYLLPIVPGLVVLAALLVVRLARRHAAWTVLAVVVWLYAAALSWTLVSRYSHDQQAAVAAWAQRQAERCAQQGTTLTVRYPASSFFGLWNALAETGVDHAAVGPGKWFDPAPDVFVLPEWFAINIDLGRMYANDQLAADLARLRAPDGAYEPVARWTSAYLQKDLYMRLDPSFDATLEQGEIGFVAYARKSASCVERDPPAGATR